MFKKIIYLLIITGLIVGGIFAYQYYGYSFGANVHLDGKKSVFLYIKSGSDLNAVTDELCKNNYLQDKESFLWTAEKKNYNGSNIVPGKYEIKNGWSNSDLINHLRAGRGRLEVNVTFNNMRSIKELAGKLGKQLEIDSAGFMELFTNADTIRRYGFNQYTFSTLFIPNTYRMDWAISKSEFLKVISKNYKDFWSTRQERSGLTKGMTQSEITTLASIVYAEQNNPANKTEWPIIAGLYLNRLNKGIRLQSDPTVIFGIGDFTIRRVLNVHLEYDSPYNTYRNAGLPPGPINFPPPEVIDAVLQYNQNDYIYMCAKAGGVGLHNFAKTLEQHNQNAQEYRAWLNKNNIR